MGPPMLFVWFKFFFCGKFAPARAQPGQGLTAPASKKKLASDEAEKSLGSSRPTQHTLFRANCRWSQVMSEKAKRQYRVLRPRAHVLSHSDHCLSLPTLVRTGCGCHQHKQQRVLTSYAEDKSNRHDGAEPAHPHQTAATKYISTTQDCMQCAEARTAVPELFA